MKDFLAELDKRIERVKNETWHDEKGKQGVITSLKLARELYVRCQDA
jgi:hypothetical protein